MGVKEWEKILKDGSCYGVTCLECDDKMNSRECRFRRKDGTMPSLLGGGLDDVARAKIEAALREAKATPATSEGAVETVEPSTITGAWIRDVQRVYARLELTEVNVVGIGVKALRRPETASYARVCERLYRRRFEV